MIRVSPFHRIELAEALLPMLDKPPEHDYVIRRISQKSVNGQPLIQGELVVSGADTREAYPLAREFPVHFRKTYYPICFHQNPAREYENHLTASEIIPAIPPPIGSTRTSFRSCFFPGKPYASLSPFGADPPERNIEIGRNTGTGALIGLWNLLVSVHEQIARLHECGFAHGDLFLHNVIITTSPIGAQLIDFEQAARRTDFESAESWEEKKFEDLRHILTEAVYLQCALGGQNGPLAATALESLPGLVKDPDRFLRAIARREAAPL